jgi:hypothetical protein
MAQAPLLTLIFHGSFGAYREEGTGAKSGAADRVLPRQFIDFVQLLDSDFGAISAYSLPFQPGDNIAVLRGPEHDRFYVIARCKENPLLAHTRKQRPRAGQLLKSRLKRWQQAPEQTLAPDPNAPGVEL